MTRSAYSESKLNSLIVDAEYVAVELARGDAVPPAVMTKAKKEIAALVDALLAAKSHVAVIDGRPQLQPSDAQYAALQKAMIELMAALAPVTITSLKDTDNGLGSLRLSERMRRAIGDDAQGEDASNGDKDVMGRRGRSVADKFSDQIFMTTMVLLAASLCTSALASSAVCAVTCSNEASALARALCAFGQFILPTATVLQPAVLGGLGACVYLLRSLHKHIYERTFDVRYQPEYWNRVILGVVSGAIVTLLSVKSLGLEGLGVMGSAALAFVVGYNTDLLFSLIERLSFALFPKVPSAPAVAPEPPRPSADIAPQPPTNGTRVMPPAPPPSPAASDSGNGKPAALTGAPQAVKDAKPGMVKP